MTNMRLLDVGIGIVLLLLLVSLLVTVVQEGIASLFKLRAANLLKAVVNLVGEVRATQVYNHPLIASLYRGKPGAATLAEIKKRLPSYIPSSTFVVALLDTFHKEQNAAKEPNGPPYASGEQLLGGAR